MRPYCLFVARVVSHWFQATGFRILIGQREWRDVRSTNSKQGCKCIYGPRVSSSARSSERLQEGGLPFGLNFYIYDNYYSH
jgi:hypothetical protein